MSAHSTLSLQTKLLRSVSRSFYLSIRFLPAQLRQPIALAYLLARSTDTVADTTGISRLVRIETLKMFSNGIQGKASRDVVVDLIGSFIPLQANKNEQQLLKSLPHCLDWQDQIEHADRYDIRVVPLPIWMNTHIWLPVVWVSFGHGSVSGMFGISPP